MQKPYALLHGSVVDALIVTTDEHVTQLAASGIFGTPVEIVGDWPAPGWTWGGDTFTPPVIPAQE